MGSGELGVAEDDHGKRELDSSKSVMGAVLCCYHRRSGIYQYVQVLVFV